jgi:hypothetical protein
MVEFPPFGERYSNKHSYPLYAVPVQPLRNEERVKAWKEFIDAMQTAPPITVHGKIPCRWRIISASLRSSVQETQIMAVAARADLDLQNL